MHERRVNDHAAYVKATVNSVLGQTLTDPISHSWRRCVRELKLDPSCPPEVAVINEKEQRLRQEKLHDVLAIARPEVRNLYEQIAGSGFAVMMADPDGVILEYVCDPGLTESFAERGLCVGGLWDEAHQGTNAMGTCLLEKEPLIVHQKDHFLPRNISLTCSGAQIFSHDGTLISVLNASGRSQVAQRHTLALVNTSARTVENLLFLHSFREATIVRFHNRAEFVGRMREGLIAVSDKGSILGTNRYALSLLALAGHEDILGKPFQRIFKMTLKELTARTAERSGTLMPIYEWGQDRRYFATIKTPERVAKSNERKSGQGKRPAATDHHDPFVREIMLDELALGDARMATNVQYVKSVQDREIPILVYGETGTGKEVMARAIHASRDGDRRPFIAVNCASIPETLIESELFGYSPGAFTGALREGQKGMIYQADRGTLFLDEIGDMPIQLQSRLLRVLEEREVHPLGGEKTVKVDIALISATHRDLTELVAAGRFRSDLYYRLQGLVLSLPPLRERSDKRSLIRHMIELESHRHMIMAGNSAEKAQFAIDEHALELLEQYDWPGNIRQLRNVIRVALAVCAGSMIVPDVLPQEIRRESTSLIGAAGVDVTSSAKLDHPPEPMTARVDENSSGLNAVENAERAALAKEFERHHWNIASVARSLNLSRPTLYRKMRRLRIYK